MNAGTPPAPARRGIVLVFSLASLLALAALLALGTWQMQRLHWKQALLATIEERIAAEPHSLADIQTRVTTTDDVEYWRTEAAGAFRHEGERHFFATHQGHSGYFVYTPLALDDGRFLLVNRGFVPYELKEPTTRPESQVEGRQTIRGLARDRLDGKPSWLVPDNDTAKNVFYWKDWQAMIASSGVGTPDDYLPFFLDADDTPNPGGLPVGGVTIVDLPNSHLQYAVTWYGLAAALAGVFAVWLWRQRKP